jgi:hypothetical protein
MFTCPVCFYDKMPDAPESYNICPCCGTEFGTDDEERTPAQLREYWISSGAKWFYQDAPPTWNAWFQLSMAGVVLPYTSVLTVSGPTPSPYYVAHGASPRERVIAPDEHYPSLAEAA